MKFNHATALRLGAKPLPPGLRYRIATLKSRPNTLAVEVRRTGVWSPFSHVVACQHLQSPVNGRRLLATLAELSSYAIAATQAND